MTREIDHVGPINEAFVSSIIKIVLSYPEDVDTLVLKISSGGGDIGCGVTAYNYLKSLPYTIHTYNMGNVASAAILPFLAGSVRTADPVLKFVFHPVSIPAQGNLSFAALDEKLRLMDTDLRSYAEIVEREAPAFAAEHDMIHLLKYETVILSDSDECRRLGILTEDETEGLQENSAGETGEQKFITG